MPLLAGTTGSSSFQAIATVPLYLDSALVVGLVIALMVTSSLGTFIWATQLKKRRNLQDRLPLLVTLAFLPVMVAIAIIFVVIGILGVGLIWGPAQVVHFLTYIEPLGPLIPLGIGFSVLTMGALLFLHFASRRSSQ